MEMTEELIIDTIMDGVKKIAPEAAIEGMSPDKRFRNQFEFDSVDFMNFAIALQEEFRIPIPEKDFHSLSTLNGCAGYLLSRGAAITAPKKPE